MTEQEPATATPKALGRLTEKERGRAEGALAALKLVGDRIDADRATIKALTEALEHVDQALVQYNDDPILLGLRLGIRRALAKAGQ